MENITVEKGGGGCSTNGHITVGKEGGVGRRGREKGGREEGGVGQGGEGERRGERERGGGGGAHFVG